jgi:hypothetical protein
MSLSTPHVFEVDKQNLHKTRITELDIDQALAVDEVLLKVDKFALTANNISYGIAGESLGYWRFFPTSHSAENPSWGRLPVMGYADVIASNCDQVLVGERVWGFLPMASHVKILAGRITPSSFSDVSVHREGLAPFYAAFDRTSKNPFYRQENEDYEILLRGLFTTSWLINDFMQDHAYFGAEQYLITSASSKTSIALAFTIKQAAERSVIGITSEANRKFVESLGCYDNVICYDEVSSLDASVPSILVDMAGSAKILSNLHHHFGLQLSYSCLIGATHHDDLYSQEKLPGPTPTFFFAPTQLKKRMIASGTGNTMKQISTDLISYIDFCRATLSISHTTDTDKLEAVYQQILSGTADAAIGRIVSL